MGLTMGATEARAEYIARMGERLGPRFDELRTDLAWLIMKWAEYVELYGTKPERIALFVVPTITFGMLFGFVVLHHGRRQLVHVGVTAHPTAEWISHQISEAFPWDRAPRHLIRDRDGAFGEIFKQRLHAMGIRDRPTAPRSPWAKRLR